MLLAVIALVACLATMLGGLLASRMFDKLHLILGFSAGAVIGVAFFDLLPESLALGYPNYGTQLLLTCTAVGFLSYLVLDRILLLHGDAAHRGPFTASILCIHSYLDGIAVGLAFHTSQAIGIVVGIAVLTHDFSDGINTMNVVLKNRGSRTQGFRWLALDAAAPVLGIVSTLFFELPAAQVGLALALIAGFFLYIGATDLIPESYHVHPKFLTTAMTLAGAAVLYVAIHLLG